MGDRIGSAVTGTLAFVPADELQRVLQVDADPLGKAALFAQLCRINALYMIANAGSGHIGTSFSSMDIISWLHLLELAPHKSGSDCTHGDVFFSSKGHDAPAIYSALIALGRLDFDLIHKLRRLGGLPGHPDVNTPGIVTNTGSLGMGVSKAKGMIKANRIQNKPCRFFVLTGDGELQEGQFWESLISAANHRLGELTVIVDHNKLQSDTLVSKVSDLGDLEEKLFSFGWHVERCDGHNISSLAQAYSRADLNKHKPKIIIADTVKGKGVSFMEHTSIDSDVEFYQFHSGAPLADAYEGALAELIAAANANLAEIGVPSLQLETVQRRATPTTRKCERIVHAYSSALIEKARQNRNLIALDADLVLDTGLIPFQQKFPERIVECGIAEQDMVSQAGGFALSGLTPIVHSFSCFLSTRPNEQIYNNCTEQRKIIYVGSLAGIVPAGPGHSHQAVRDISTIGSMPNLVAMEPSCEREVGMLLDWCIDGTSLSSYLRLTSVPWPINFRLPDDYQLALGQGTALTEGNDAVVISYGPVMLSAAVAASIKIFQEYGLKIKVINLPWLNVIDGEWLSELMLGVSALICLDNHYRVGGQGDRIAKVVAERGIALKVFKHIAVDDIPACGSNNEVLEHHGLDAAGIQIAIEQALLGSGSR